MAAARERSKRQQTQRAPGDSDPAADSATPASSVSPPAADTLALVGDPRLGGRGNRPLQTALLLDLQHHAGNRALQRMLNQHAAQPAAGAATARPAPRVGSVPVQRDHLPPGVHKALHQLGASPQQFVWQYADQIGADLTKQMNEVDLPLNAPGAAWLAGDGKDFVARTMKPIATANRDRLWAVLAATLAPSSPDWAVAAGEYGGQGLHEVDEYNPAVALELRKMYVSALTASLARVLPRYLQARNQAFLHENAGRRRDQPTRVQPDLLPEPAPNALVAAHALDSYVFAALRSGTVEFDPHAYQARHPEEQTEHPAAPLRSSHGPTATPFDIHFLINQKLWTWLRVTSPPDATPEEVALEIYGDAALGSSLVAAPPLFGFDPARLTGRYATEWRKQADASTNPGSAAGIWHLPEDVAAPHEGAPRIDPLGEALRGPLMDEMALNQARAYQPTGASQGEIIDTMETTLANLRGSLGDIYVLGVGGQVHEVANRLQTRIAALAASNDPAAARAWDAQAAGQRYIVEKASIGLHKAAVEQRKLDKAGKALPPYVTGPLASVAMLYNDALQSSELVSVGLARLAAAEEKSKTYPIDMLEGILQYLRQMMESAEIDKTKAGVGGSQGFGLPVMESREEGIRLRLARAREILLADPGKAAPLIMQIQQDISDLQGETTAVANMDLIDSYWDLLISHFSGVGAVTGKNADYVDRLIKLEKWRGRWHAVKWAFQEAGGPYSFWSREEDLAHEDPVHPGARQALRNLQKDGDAFQRDMEEVLTFFNERERREAALKLVLNIAAMIGIALVTSGIGELVGGALTLGAGWGETALGTTLVVSGAEAATFTAATTALFERDPTVMGVIGHFLENWATFGILRGIGAAYEKALPEFAKTGAGKVVGGATQFLSGIVLALGEEYAHRKLRGEDMSAAEVRAFVQENVASTIFTMLGARVAGPVLKEFQHIGGDTYKALFGEVEESRAVVRELAQQGQLTKDIKQLPRALDQDAAAMKKELELIEAIKEFAAKRAAAGESVASPEALKHLEELGRQTAQARDANRRQGVMLRLQDEGASVRSSEPHEKFDDIVKELRSLGDTVEELPAAADGTRSVRVKPATASGEEPYVIRERYGEHHRPAALTRPPELRPDGAPAAGASTTAGDGYNDVYTALRAKHKLSEEVTQILRRHAVKPEVFERLLSRGIHAEDIGLYTLQLESVGVEVIDLLLAHKGIKPGVAVEIAQRAEALGLLSRVQELLPNLENPQALRQLLKDIERDVVKNVHGALQELNDAAERALKQDPGKKVRLGGEADVVDPTAGEAVQHKNLKAADERGVRQEMQGAANQLMGWGSKNTGEKAAVTKREKPPAGFKRVVSVTVRYAGSGKRNPLLTADEAQLTAFVHETFADRPGQVDRVYFTNERGTFVLEGPNFKVVKMTGEAPGGGGGSTGAGGGSGGSSGAGGGGGAGGAGGGAGGGGKKPPGGGAPPVPAGPAGGSGGIPPTPHRAEFAAVSTGPTLGNWKFTDTTRADGDLTIIRTEVTDPHGNTGYAERGYNKKTGELRMMEIDLQKVERKIALPDGPEMNVSNFLTVRQLKLFGVTYGEPSKVVMKDIYNLDTVLALDKLVREGKPRETAILETPSVKIAERTIATAGKRIDAVKVSGGVEKPAKEMLEWLALKDKKKPEAGIDPQLYQKNLDKLKEKGYDENSKLFYEFDIELELKPRDTAGP